MLSITELPRKEGIVDGAFFAHHKSDSFGLEGYGFKFREGTTVAPVLQRVHERLFAAYGGDVSFIPADRESADKAIAWMLARPEQNHESRVAIVKDAVAALFPDHEADHARRNVETVVSLKAQAAAAEAAELKALEAEIAALPTAKTEHPPAAASGLPGGVSPGAAASSSSKDKGKK